jgi:complement component 1 Q subcomponent-binding protein
MLDDSTPPPPPPPPAPFAVEDRPGEQWARLRSVFPAAEGEEEEVTVDATLVDGALPPTRSGADTGGPPRLHITVASGCGLLPGCILPRAARPC